MKLKSLLSLFRKKETPEQAKRRQIEESARLIGINVEAHFATFGDSLVHLEGSIFALTMLVMGNLYIRQELQEKKILALTQEVKELRAQIESEDHPHKLIR